MLEQKHGEVFFLYAPWFLSVPGSAKRRGNMTNEQHLLDALKALWKLHLEVTGKQKRTSKLDIEDYYTSVENKVKNALTKAGE